MALTFCGASVRGYSSNIGWNEQQSSLRVSVVEDADNADFFAPPGVGTPIYFSHGSFTFSGLLQRWVKSNAVDGLPTYDVECVDPRQILDGAQIITGSYRGTVGINNIYNAFGYYEGTSFGSSLSNDAGMPFYKVRDAVTQMANLLVGDYGTALSYRGVRYHLDLSELPSPPAYYRVPTPSISLMELINLVCEDGGCDYYITLVGTTIKVKTVSRSAAAGLGALAGIQSAGYGVDLMKSSYGLEARNEITSAFVVGAEQKLLLQTSGNTITPFWGFDTNGNPITGTGTGYNHTMNLNASEVADVLKATIYQCTVREMLFALAGWDSWVCYMKEKRKVIADTIGLGGAWGNNNIPIFLGNDAGPNPPAGLTAFALQVIANAKAAQAAAKPGGIFGFALDVIDMRKQRIQNANQAIVDSLMNINSHRMYDFVMKYANEYLGKKFLVAVPFILKTVETDTLRTIYSQEPTDAGYVDDSNDPLGLPANMRDQFQTQDGRYVGFCKFTNFATNPNGLSAFADIDTTTLGSGDDIFVDNTNRAIYMKVSIDDKLVFTPAPNVIVTLNNAIYHMPPTPVGDLDEIRAILGTMPEGFFRRIAKNVAGGTLMGLKFHALPYQPTSFAVPLKSNILTYGPWAAQGAPGKVKFEYDQTLTPWNYGGFNLMNLAGQAKVAQSITNLQVVETGSHEFVGAPKWSLGETLSSGGPNITGIDVSYGAQGMTTSLRETTFTPRFGAGGFNKDTAHKLERIGRRTTELKKSIRLAYNHLVGQNTSIRLAKSRGWLLALPQYIKKESPHTTFISDIIDDPSVTGGKRVSIGSGTLQEIMEGCGADDDDMWKQTAIMSLSGLIRPFSTKTDTDADISALTEVKSGFTGTINKDTYNPFGHGNDINTTAWGDTYDGANRYIDNDDADNTRVMALRGPLMVNGWGQTIDGKYVPGSGDGSGNPSSAYISDYMKKSHLWKTGPVDLLWDDNRGVWTCHDLLEGKTKGVLSPGGTGLMTVYKNGVSTGYDLPISNWFSGTNAGVSGNINIIAGYCVTSNKWRVIAADCS